MNATKYNFEQELKLKTIEQNHDQEQQTIQRIVNTSPIKIKSNNKQFNTLEKQYEITSLGKKTKLFMNDINIKETINHRDDITRHRRNKTQADVRHKGKQKDPVYNCLYVPFLQTKGFEMGKSLVKRPKHQKSYSTQKQKITQPSQLKSQRSFSQPNNKTQNRQKGLSLPGIRKSILSSTTGNNNNVQDIGHKRLPAQKIDGTQTFSNNKLVPVTRIGQLKNTTMIEKQKSQQKQLTKEDKNVKEFRLRERQIKIKFKKVSKKVQQWKEINFLQLKTCYFHIQKKMNSNSQINSSKDYSTLNCSTKLNSQRKNLKKEILMHQRTPKVPKFPNSADEVSLIIKNFTSIRKNKASIDSLIKSKNFKVKYVDKNMLYFGQMVNEVFDGYGILVKPDQIFQGTWKEGKKISGTQFKKGIYFEGNYIDGKKQGFGISYWNHGFDQYSGEWKNGLKNGNGVWKNLDGDQYIGQWINGKVQGYGVHTTVDGQKYQGYFVNFLKHGKGKQTFPNGDFFQGNFSQGKPQGQGVYKFNRGQVKYEGNFSKGLRTGKGKLTVPNLLIYQGQFQNDVVHGHGKINYLNNDSYLGQFKQGLRHGQGTFHNVKQNIVLTGIWNRGNFFSKSQQQNITKFQNK